MSTTPGPEIRESLVGRDAECGLLDALVSDVRLGKSRSLVLRGEAGIGKTALLEYTIGSAPDLTVVRAVGAESEMELAYASLHQLCGPMLDRVARLPAPQRDALRTVFGLIAGAVPDRFLVGLAVLSLFSEAADERPLLCVVDDAQWMDQASAMTLAFVARRLLADRVGIVFAAREPGDELAHLPGLEVRGLVNGDARPLLSSLARFTLDQAVRDRIIEETHGNPLALLELTHRLTAAQLAGGFGLRHPQGICEPIEASFVPRLAPVPEHARGWRALTGQPARRAERALADAQTHFQAGAFEAALQLLPSAEAGSLDEPRCAELELLRGQIASASTPGDEAPALMLLEAAGQLESLDTALARETYLAAWAAAANGGRFARVALHEISRAAVSAPQPTSAPRPSDLLLDGLSALVADGRAAAEPKLRRAASAFAGGELDTADELRWGWLAGVAAITLWDEDSWHRMILRQLQTVRAAGLRADLPIYLQANATLVAWRGDFARAASLIAEADAVAEATGMPFPRTWAVILSGFRGKKAEASPLTEAEVRNASAAGQGIWVQACQRLSAVLCNGLGAYDQALAEAQRASEEAPELFIPGWALPELIEAATRTGKTRLAGEALDRLAVATSIGDSDWGLGVYARSRAMLSEGQDAEGSYREAIERLGRTRLRVDLARARLLYGEWLRRERRRLDAREQLRTALEMFTRMGIEAFAGRAERELLATSEHVRKRSVESRDELTAQESQVARLARDGLSNAQIGERLFISQHTVAYHLRKVFSKLGITSRTQLGRALPGSTDIMEAA